MTPETRDLAITAELTADPQVCRFLADRSLHDGGAVHCRQAADADGSPLLAEIFSVAGVTEVLVMQHLVTVRKSDDRPWQQTAREVGNAIRRAAASGTPLIAADWNARTVDDGELRARVEAILDKDINPQIASHGGWVRVADVKGTTVYVEMGGGCQGCASSQATLRNGVERAIRQHVREVTQIVDVTDHGAGTNPYYR